ncbi:MAG: folate-binding protein [Rhodospirillum sp.]|nr:folate-binding protein [Rhodospirillum sp.]MCF8488650.1 folate-binding protein [Rhodospirillum sp.]MCF8501745.1 folate-binding protein [Rhodospirillum sp.]
MTDLLLCPLSDRGVLTLAGDDRVTFLQGLVSNDVTKATGEKAIWAALLTPQGKYMHDFFLVEREGTLLIRCEVARMDDLKTRLSRFKLRSKVVLAPGEGWTVAVVPGADAAAALGLPAEPGATRILEGGALAFVDPRLAEAGVHLLIPPGAIAPALPRGNGLDWRRRAASLGLPDGAPDMEPDKALLLENGFEELGGVDFKKGCYMGQELTARTKYRGLVKKRLMPITLTGGEALPTTGSLLRAADGSEAGEVRSVITGIEEGQGLAVIRLAQFSPGVTLTAEDGGATVTPIPPDWMVLPEPKPEPKEA